MISLSKVRRFEGRRAIAAGLIVLALCVAGVVSARSSAVLTGTAEPAAHTAAAQAVPDGPTASGGPPAVYIYLTASGFARDRFTFHAGPRRLVVKNISTYDRLRFAVTAADGRTVFEGGFDNGQTRMGVVTLEPGEYRVTEASRPDWVCHVTIVP
jgi:hypothetical protein